MKYVGIKVSSDNTVLFHGLDTLLIDHLQHVDSIRSNKVLDSTAIMVLN